MDAVTPKKQDRKARSIVVVGNRTREMFSISLLLQRFEYDVVTASTAAEALERIAAAMPALIISDLTLPGMSGMDLMHLLRQEKRTASIPVVFVIPLSDASAEMRCHHAGARCVTKPIMAEDLYRTVQQAIEVRPRENLRIETRLAVSLDNVPVDCTEGLCEIDLSEHGMYVPTPKPLPRNRRITVQINIKDHLISTDSAVLYSHSFAIGPHKHPGMGLKFINLAPQDQDAIRKYIRDEITRDIKAAITSNTTETW
jgi:CheY-like chemotaxis protein